MSENKNDDNENENDNKNDSLAAHSDAKLIENEVEGEDSEGGESDGEVHESNNNNNTNTNTDPNIPTSKKGMKKYLKRMRMEEANKERKILSRQKKKQRNKRLKAEISNFEKGKEEKEKEREQKGKDNATNVETSTDVVNSLLEEKTIRWKRLKRKDDEIQYKGAVVIDLDFEKLMTEKEMKSLISQVTFSYAENRRMDIPFNLHYTGVGESMREKFKKIQGYDHWKLNQSSEPYLSLFPKEKLVYLTSDSPHVLQSISRDDVYIIGGIVDKNRYKGLTYEKAQKEGIRSVQLPIGEYLKMSSRKVLTVNQVFEIIARVAENGGNWLSALEKIIPQRKQATALNGDDADSEQDENDREKNNDNNNPSSSSSSTTTTTTTLTSPPSNETTQQIDHTNHTQTQHK